MGRVPVKSGALMELLAYEVREHNRPDKGWMKVNAIDEQDAIEQLLRQGRWYTIEGVTELIDVKVEREPKVMALTATGLVTRTI